jgi:hypothetical protein
MPKVSASGFLTATPPPPTVAVAVLVRAPHPALPADNVEVGVVRVDAGVDDADGDREGARDVALGHGFDAGDAPGGLLAGLQGLCLCGCLFSRRGG